MTYFDVNFSRINYRNNTLSYWLNDNYANIMQRLQKFQNKMADSEGVENIKSVSADDLSRCVDEVKKIFDVNELSANQFDGLLHFLNGRDVFFQFTDRIWQVVNFSDGTVGRKVDCSNRPTELPAKRCCDRCVLSLDHPYGGSNCSS